MRRLTLILLVLLLVPSAALGEGAASGDGSLVVSSASARIIIVQGKGLVYGHINQGTLTVTEYKGSDSSSVQVSGSISKQLTGSSMRYTGSDIRFMLPNGHYSLTFDGVGIDISAVGKGAVSAIGIGSADDGSLATNGGKPMPLNVAPTTLVFGASKAPNASPSGFSAKGMAR